jgi:phospholipase/carboxylesterase
MFAKTSPLVAFRFPNAPIRPTTISEGVPMSAWFDLDTLPVTRMTPEDVPGILASAAVIQGLIAEEIKKGTPSERIFLGGFSQGAALSLVAGLRNPTKLGGIIAFSGWLPSASLAAPGASSINANTPILMVHGQYDSKVDFVLAEDARSALSSHPLTWHSFDGDHEFFPPSAQFLREFVEAPQ